jgi:CDP-diacylglycerol--serine O-phosphatidyltransferase
MPPKEKLIAVIPTLLTLGNAMCGFGAITFAAKLGPTYTEHYAGTALLIAGTLIYAAMLFDAFDGSAARLMNQTSDFGAQLDSLCDAISFGVAPAYLMLQLMVHSFGPDVTLPFNYHPRLLWMIAVLFVLCAILRLARFNVETDEEDSHDFFSGLPSPAAAGVVASFPFIMWGLKDLVIESNTVEVSDVVNGWVLPTVKLLMPLITLAVALLMVSRFRYVHAFNHLFRGRKGPRHMVQLVVTAIVIFLAFEFALPVIFFYFAFSAPASWLWGEIVRGRLGKPTQA